MPPQPTQPLPPQTENGAVQPRPAPQQLWPLMPQAPPWQPPFVQVPWPPAQLAPLATQVDVDRF